MRQRLIFMAPLLTLVLAAVPACNTTPEATPAKAADGSVAPARVTTVKPTRGLLRRVTDQPARVEAAESTPVHAKLAGYVKRVAVDVGDRVKTGQVLAEIDAPEEEAGLVQKQALVQQAAADKVLAVASVAVARSLVRSADAKAEEAKASTRRVEAEVARWQTESARIDQLARESAVTGSLRDETRSKLEAARAALDETGARIRSAEAARDETRAGLDKAEADVVAASARIDVARADARRAAAVVAFATLAAPFDGVVTRRNVDTGHLTVAGGSAAPLFVIDRIDRVTVVASVPEAEAALVGPGDSVKVRLQALQGRTIDGKVTRTSFALDESTRTLHVEVDLPNTDGTLRPGLYAHATIVVDERPDALAVPAAALTRDGGKVFCVVVADGRAHRREIRVGLSDGSKVEILSGLSAEDAVAAANPEGLAEGQSVQSIPSENSGATSVKP